MWTICLKNSKKIGVSDIVIPCVDQSSLNSTNAENLFIKSLTEVLPFAEDYEINLSLETDLNPKSFITSNDFGRNGGPSWS